MNKLLFAISFLIIFSYTSCNKDIGGGKNPAPDIYYIIVEGKKESEVTITYSAAIPKNTYEDGSLEVNKYITQKVTLPFYKIENFWRDDRNITKPSVSLTNSTSQDISVLLNYEADTLMTSIDGVKFHISPILRYHIFGVQNIEPEYKELDMDSLYSMLKKMNYDGLKIFIPNENGKVELYQRSNL